MKKLFLLFLSAVILLSAALPVLAYADVIWPTQNNEPVKSNSEPFGEASTTIQIDQTEKLLWTNINTDPVSGGPKYQANVPVNQDPVLVTKIRTYHYNNGSGARPGTISVYESNEWIGSWIADGVSDQGIQNAYWEVRVSVIMYPGHSYRIQVSDNDSWSYNAGSGNCGMFELYGIFPAPEEYLKEAESKAFDQQAYVTVFQDQSTSPSPAQSYGPPAQRSGPVLQYFSGTEISAIPSVLNAGTTFRMGRYEQDNDPNDGTESIEWQVLTVQKDRVLVISRYALDVKGYIEMTSNKTWETSSFRRWLNEDFYNQAFTAEEKNRILSVMNENPDNPQFGTMGGNKTQDRIFLLSYKEAEQYFSSDSARKCQPTAYTVANGVVFEEASGTTIWYLRSPGLGEGISAVIGTAGEINYGGPVCSSGCESVFFAMRPAFWLSLPPSGFKVTYNGNNCLAKVPTDSKIYQPGNTVTVLFDPVEYMPGMIFYGWDGGGDGVADYGYYYNSFTMPARDVELKAICYVPYQQQYDHQNQNQQYQIITDDNATNHNNQNGPFEITNPNSGWWVDYGSTGDYYDGVG